jgi:DNA-binding transcriptional LysR family regulator
MPDLRTLAGVDLNHLVAFLALYEARSVTRAGHRLGLSQSAVSHVLRHLRARFDDPLFVRVGREMVPTPRADALAVQVGRGLGTLGRALAEPDGFDPATSTRTFRLASLDLFDCLVLPTLAGLLAERAPGCRLAVRGPVPRAALEAGEIDAQVLPVVPGSGDTPSTGPLRRAHLLRDGWRTYMRAGHPLEDGLALAPWCAARHLLISPGGEGPGLVDRVLAAEGLSRDVCLRIPAFAAALGIIASTDLVLTGPASLARLAGPEVGVHPVPLALPEHAVVLVWSERVDADPGGRWFRALVREAAP